MSGSGFEVDGALVVAFVAAGFGVVAVGLGFQRDPVIAIPAKQGEAIPSVLGALTVKNHHPEKHIIPELREYFPERNSGQASTPKMTTFGHVYNLIRHLHHIALSVVKAVKAGAFVYIAISAMVGEVSVVFACSKGESSS